MQNLSIAGRSFQLKLFTLADTANETIREQSAAIIDLFLKREAEFDVHESMVYDFIAIDMPAGPEHTAAFILEPSASDWDGRTLYIEAVNEDDDKIKPSFVFRLSDQMGRLCGGACGVIHERQGKRYAYLGTMALASGMPQGTGTAIMEQVVQFLHSQKVEAVHLGTQTAARFYEKNGFKVDHRLIRNLRVRRKDGQEVLGDLVMLSMAL